MAQLDQHPVIQQYIRWNVFGKLLGMDFTIPEQGKVIYTMTIGPDHLATPVASHGGAVAALMDATLGVACLSSVCEDDRVVSTVSLSMQFIAPAKLGDRLEAHAEVVKAGKRLLFVEGKIRNQRGELVATGSGTMNAYPIDKLKP